MCFLCNSQIRGKFRSRTVESIVSEADLYASGVKELALVAQDTTAWSDLKNAGLADLRELLPIGFDWLRILYTYPTSLGRIFLN